jgi:hypothetical protein
VLGEGLYRVGFGLTVEDVTDQLSGPGSVADLGDGAERARQPESSGDDLGEFDRCGGHEPHGFTGSEMALSELAGSVPDPCAEALVVDPLAKRDDLCDPQARAERQRSVPQVRDLTRTFATPAIREMVPRVAGDLSARDEPMAHHSDAEVEQHRTFDQGVVEVEERGVAHHSRRYNVGHRQTRRDDFVDASARYLLAFVTTTRV